MKTHMSPEPGNPVDPRNSAAVYDKAATDFRAKAPELLTYKYIVRPAIEKALNEHVSEDRDQKTVLDIGSASGRNVHTLIELGFSAKNIHGVEISPEQVQIAKREIPDATFEVGDISTHKLTPDTNDLAIMVMVAEFLDPEKYSTALVNIYDSMKKGGTFIYITTHPDRYKAKYGVTKGEVTTNGPWSNDKFSNYVRSVKKQVEALKNIGFDIKSFEHLDIPNEVEAQDQERRSQFTYPDSHARLVVVVQKPKN